MLFLKGGRLLSKGGGGGVIQKAWGGLLNGGGCCSRGVIQKGEGCSSGGVIQKGGVFFRGGGGFLTARVVIEVGGSSLSWPRWISWLLFFFPSSFFLPFPRSDVHLITGSLVR